MSHAEAQPDDPPLPPTHAQESKLKRDDWMLMGSAGPSTSTSVAAHASTRASGIPDDMGAPELAGPSTSTHGDFFSEMGTERKRKPKPDVPDPEKATSPTISSVHGR
jgi:hypothetical protein